MANVQTVRIKGGEGEPAYLIINAEDFDEAKMELYVEQEVPAAESGSGGGSEGGGSEGDDAPTLAGLMKLTKSELLEAAKEKGLAFPVPDEVTKEVIANAILAVPAAE